MEELLIKFMYGECSKDEIDLIEKECQSNADFASEVRALQKLDNIMKVNSIASIDPAFNARLLNQLTPKALIKVEEKSKISDFLFPIIFGIGALIYAIFSNSLTTTSNFADPALTAYIPVIFLSLLCLTGFYFLDQYLFSRRNINAMLSLI